jgi:cytochrome c oxidase assembly protein subunit 16
LVAGGSYGLSVFTEIRYKVSSHKNSLGLTKEELIEKGWKDKKVDLLEEYKEMKENVDINNWDNIRGPRPWEDDNTKYIEIINKRIQEHEEKSRKKGSIWV